MRGKGQALPPLLELTTACTVQDKTINRPSGARTRGCPCARAQIFRVGGGSANRHPCRGHARPGHTRDSREYNQDHDHRLYVHFHRRGHESSLDGHHHDHDYPCDGFKPRLHATQFRSLRRKGSGAVVRSLWRPQPNGLLLARRSRKTGRPACCGRYRGAGLYHMLHHHVDAQARAPRALRPASLASASLTRSRNSFSLRRAGRYPAREPDYLLYFFVARVVSSAQDTVTRLGIGELSINHGARTAEPDPGSRLLHRARQTPPPRRVSSVPRHPSGRSSWPPRSSRASEVTSQLS